MNKTKNKTAFLVQESQGTTLNNVYEVPQAGNKISVKRLKSDNKYWNFFDAFFRSAFLPHGYPDSVSKDYLEYQVWDSIQAFASSITGSICTHAVLTGAGVGDKDASALAATLTWLYKDGTSMVGRIVFAWSKGTKLDCDCKKWRLFADVMNDLALLLDLLSACFRGHFLLIICLSGLIKSIVGVAGGSTRAALTQHQARKNNMADVSAKDGSQETLVNLLALICSLFLVPIVTESSWTTGLVFIIMTAVHLLANYFAVSAVCMDTFNIPRFKTFAECFLSNQSPTSLSVYSVNKKESVFFSIWPKKVNIHLGSSFKLLTVKRKNDVREILKVYKDSNYILYLTDWSLAKASVYVAFNRKADVQTQMQALYQACILIHWQNEMKMWPPNVTPQKSDLLVLEKASLSLAQETFEEFLNCVKSNGFKTNTTCFEIDTWRLEW